MREKKERGNVLTRICGRCGRVVKQGERCECEAERQHEYDCEHRNGVSRSFYNSKSWKLMQKAVAARAGFQDEYLKFYRARIVPGRVAHHIAPISERPELKLDGRNIIYVSDKTHRMIHAEYSKGAKEKEEMQRRLYRVRMELEKDEGPGGG